MDKINWEKIRDDFPILKTKYNNLPLVYLDNSATSQKPQQVLSAISELYTKYNANIHRGIYRISEETTLKYEESKKTVAKFINAKSFEEIVYTKNTTESINIAALILERELKENDEILVTIMEHHSNLIPWMKIAERKKCKLIYINLNEDGSINIEDLKKKITEKTKIISISHISNVLGTINRVKEIIELVKNQSIYTVVDGAQAVGHIKVDIQDLNPDFYCFSGHKMLAPTGIGIMYAKKSLLEKFDPIFYGGDMISNVEKYSIDYNDLPWKFEAGTSNYEGAIGLNASIEYINSIGIENIHKRVIELKDYLEKKILEIDGVKIYGNTKDKTGITSFTYSNIHPHDIASLLDRSNICIRAGNHCANPLIEELKVPALARASLYFYNSHEDIDIFINSLRNIKSILK